MPEMPRTKFQAILSVALITAPNKQFLIRYAMNIP